MLCCIAARMSVADRSLYGVIGKLPGDCAPARLMLIRQVIGQQLVTDSHQRGLSRPRLERHRDDARGRVDRPGGAPPRERQGAGRVDREVLPRDEELVAAFLDVDAKLAARPRVDRYVSRDRWPGAHPLPEGLRI